MTEPLLLASASPRRRELLAGVGLAVDVFAVEIDESPRPGEAGDALALRLAREKARAAASARPGRDVLAADTVVIIDGDSLGKPGDAAEAASMLRRLSGRWHTVVTGVALVQRDGTVCEASARTDVRFAAIDDDEIARYVAGAEPYDKAGGYAVQGAASWFVEEVRGSVSNVIGLPLEQVRRLLRAAGLPGPHLETR